MTISIKRLVCMVGAVLMATADSAAALNPEKIAEIAATLPETPRADGASASDRAKWDPFAVSEAGKKIVAEAEKIAAEPVPAEPDNLYLEFSKNGNRSNYEKCHFRRKRDFASLYVAECLEHKGRFIPKIVEYLDAYCAMKSWTLPAHDGELECFKGNPHVDLTSANDALKSLGKNEDDEIVTKICGVYAEIADNPSATLSAIAQTLGLSERTVDEYVSILKGIGVLRRKDGRKFGTWEILT